MTRTHTISIEVEDPMDPDRLSPEMLLGAAQRAVEGMATILATAPVVRISIDTYESEAVPSSVKVTHIDSQEVQP